MSEKVLMPELGESVTEGVVTRWMKQVGDTVAVDEPLLEVSTDKVDTEVPSPVAGTILEIVVQEDETIAVGSPVCIVGAASEAQSAPAPVQSAPAPVQSVPAPAQSAPAPAQSAPVPPAPLPPTPAPVPPAPAAPVPPTPVPPANGSYVTPIVRKLASEQGVDLNQVQGTGVGGRIRKEDVLAAATPTTPVAPAPNSEVKPSPLRGKREKMSRLRQVISERMIESLQTSAQLTTVVEVDVTRIAALRAKAKEGFASREGTKLTFLPFFVKAATEALKVHPKINASIEDKEVVYHDVEHIGIAVDTERGLLVPVVRNAGDLTIGGIAKKINDLAARTRANKVEVSELSGSTFTITNTGSGGALFDTPIINQPEVAILGLGAIQKRPAVIKDRDGNDTIAIRSLCYLALSYDHRLVDGADAARYLMTVKARLEEGDFAAELGLL